MSDTSPLPYTCLTADQAARLILEDAELRLFDVRDLHSFRQAHLPGALHLDEARAPLWLERLPHDQPLLFYCFHGNTSRKFAQLFGDLRFSRVYSVDGGYRPLADALAAASA